MAHIEVLDSHTAELIAAGEVVERPSSVVKELCENAIDAGAAHVSVAICRGGVEMIEVSDDGTGIEAESVPTAFLRHATSKIRTQDDLEAIHTLGFRGEALASIASVAHVELLTKTKDDEFACLYRISGGVEQSFEAGARGVGTTITVKNLFYNTPARMKFLKKDTSEGNYVSDVVSELALAHPEVAFRFVREGRPQFQTPGDGQLLGAAYAVLGREFSKDLLEVDGGAGPYRVAGLITPPRACRASRAMQFFFVNGRFVKNRTMMAALEAAYKGTLMQGKFPGCVLSLSMPAQMVDVNVHPAKTEVRFAREKDVFDAVYSAAGRTAPAAGAILRENGANSTAAGRPPRRTGCNGAAKHVPGRGACAPRSARLWGNAFSTGQRAARALHTQGGSGAGGPGCPAGRENSAVRSRAFGFCAAAGGCPARARTDRFARHTAGGRAASRGGRGVPHLYCGRARQHTVPD